ncbi:MAG: SURF1 family protein [Actinomycetota bacterium]|nr:SURF1 family protein [Actinomycetota bacterium]
MSQTRTPAAQRPTPDQPRQSVCARLAFLLSPGWIAAVLTALIGAALCFFVLAPWQFHRNVERSARNASIAAAINQPARPIEQRLPLGAGVPPAQVWQQATATGTFLADKQVVVRLRQDLAGQPASEVLVPLRLANGSVLLVDRGDIPIDRLAGGLPAPAPPAGTVTVVGRLQAYQPDPLNRPPRRTGERLEVYGISKNSITDLPGPVLGGFIQLVDGTPGVLNPIGVPQIDNGPFLSYAWQWLSFGTMGLLALCYFGYREFTDPRGPIGEDEEHPAADTFSSAAGPSQKPHRRRAFDRSTLYDV